MDLSAIAAALLLSVSTIGIIVGLKIWGSRVIMKCIPPLIATLLAGWIGMVIGREYLGGYPEFGCITAISVMGAAIIFSIERRGDS